jgi:hypothetical protein
MALSRSACSAACAACMLCFSGSDAGAGAGHARQAGPHLQLAEEAKVGVDVGLARTCFVVRGAQRRLGSCTSWRTSGFFFNRRHCRRAKVLRQQKPAERSSGTGHDTDSAAPTQVLSGPGKRPWGHTRRGAVEESHRSIKGTQSQLRRTGRCLPGSAQGRGGLQTHAWPC